MRVDIEQFNKRVKLSDLDTQWEATVEEVRDDPAGERGCVQGVVLYIPGVTLKQLLGKV